MTTRIIQRRDLGVRQRTMLAILADRGVWYPGVPWGITTDSRRRQRPSVPLTEKVLATLKTRGLVTTDACTSHGRACWAVTPAGYTWLADQARADLSWLAEESTAADRVLTRVAQLEALAVLAGPVDWRGVRV